MMLKSDEAVYLRWISQGRSITDIATIEQKTPEEIQQALDSIRRRLRAVSIVEVLETARSSNFV
jgi:DNA-binding CsgD family transcriptional regulator